MGRTKEVQITLAPRHLLPAGSTFRPFWIAAAIVLLCFSRVLFDLVDHALNETLHSHILLVPFIVAYLVSLKRHSLPRPASGTLPLTAVFALAGIAALFVYVMLRFRGATLSHNDYLSLNVFALCMFLFVMVIYFLGTTFARSLAFPLAFLLVLVPLPDKVTAALEIASQYASAEVYSWMMNLSGAIYYREGRTFVLPNLTIVVAQECSGIRSSLVLFITSLIAGHLFLHSTWKKVILALAVFPLGIVRNALRIYLLSMASAHWNPDIIHSPLHHRGGPIFFALSLIPLFLFLLWLRKSERKKLEVPITPAHA